MFVKSWRDWLVDILVLTVHALRRKAVGVCIHVQIQVPTVDQIQYLSAESVNVI